MHLRKNRARRRTIAGEREYDKIDFHGFNRWRSRKEEKKNCLNSSRFSDSPVSHTARCIPGAKRGKSEYTEYEPNITELFDENGHSTIGRAQDKKKNYLFQLDKTSFT